MCWWCDVRPERLNEKFPNTDVEKVDRNKMFAVQGTVEWFTAGAL